MTYEQTPLFHKVKVTGMTSSTIYNTCIKSSNQIFWNIKTPCNIFYDKKTKSKFEKLDKHGHCKSSFEDRNWKLEARELEKSK